MNAPNIDGINDKRSTGSTEYLAANNRDDNPMASASKPSQSSRAGTLSWNGCQRKHEAQKYQRGPGPADGMKAADKHERAEYRWDKRQAVDRQHRVFGREQSRRQSDGQCQ